MEIMMTRNLRQDFEALIDDLSRDPEDRYLEFLKDKSRTFQYQNLLFDVERLDSYYNCAACRQQNPRAYCCSGYDLELTGRDVDAVAGIMSDLVQMHPELKKARNGGNFWRYGEAFERMMRRKKNDDCLFLMSGNRGCMIHGWALANRVDPLAVKPYICSLYPLVVVIIGDEVVITTLNEETKVILDTGDKAMACAKKRGPPANHTLVRSREILVRMFGKKVYAQLAKRVFGE